MDRPTLTVAEVFRRHGAAYRDQVGSALSTAQRRVMTAIEQCRTAALGGHVEQCDRCGHTRVWYNSCRDRHCPQCQSLARTEWIEDREAEILPVPLCTVSRYVVFRRGRSVWRASPVNPTPHNWRLSYSDLRNVITPGSSRHRFVAGE